MYVTIQKKRYPDFYLNHDLKTCIVSYYTLVSFKKISYTPKTDFIVNINKYDNMQIRFLAEKDRSDRYNDISIITAANKIKSERNVNSKESNHRMTSVYPHTNCTSSGTEIERNYKSVSKPAFLSTFGTSFRAL